MLHGHGDDGYVYPFPISHNFSSNVWDEGMNPRLKKVLQRAMGKIEKYPDPAAEDLSILAGRHHGLKTENCLFTNGATEAFYLVAQLFAGESATIFNPTFSEYEDSCRMFMKDFIFLPRNSFVTTKFETPLAFVCNPNNPDGFTDSLAVLEKVIRRHPATTFVVDEAYVDFSKEAESCVELLNRYTNLLIVKSLTKLFCIPGLRIGYVLGDPDMIQRLKSVKMPWSVNSLAIEAGRYIFKHNMELKPDMIPAWQRSRELQTRLKSLDGFQLKPSKTTFFLLKTEVGKAAALKEYLVHEHHLLVRDATNFRGLEGEWIRIASQSADANNKLVKGLALWTRN